MPIEDKKQKLRSEEIQDILTKVPHWMLFWGNSLILGIIILFLILSALIKYPDIIRAEALIVSDISPQREYARVSGSIDTILISDNEIVKKGQTLAMIENSANLNDVLILKKYINNMDMGKGVLNFPIDSVEVLNLGEIASAYTIFESNFLKYSLHNTLQPYESQKKSNSVFKAELQSRMEILKNQRKTEAQSYSFKVKSLKRNKQLYNKGVISEQEYENEQAEFFRAENNLKSLDIAISQIKQSLNQIQEESSQLLIDSTMEDTQLYKRVLLDLSELKRAIREWEMKYVSIANLDGEISFLEVWNENQTVEQGDLLFTIIPKNTNQYIVKLKAPIQNSGKIKKGQMVNINLADFPSSEYGVLQGKVARISAVSDGKGFYYVTVYLGRNLETSYGIQIPFNGQMTGTAEIVTEDLTILGRLFYSIKDIFKN